MALHAVANAQAAGGIAAFIDAEHALDPDYARALGVDTDALLVSQPDTGEQALEIMDMLIRSGALDVIVIDSVAALVPRAEIEGEMGDSHVGLQARLMSQALRKITGALSNSGTTAIFINQLREKIGVMFGSPETTTGGKALKFYASIRLDVRRIETLKDGGEAVGNRTRVKVVKNKVGAAVQAGRVRHRLRRGHQPRGFADRRRRRAGADQQVRCLVHLRDRSARAGQGERAQLPARQPRPRRRDREEDQGEARHRRPGRRGGRADRSRCRPRSTSEAVDAVAAAPHRRRTPPAPTNRRATRSRWPGAICLQQLDRRARSRAELAAVLRRRGVPDDAAGRVSDRFAEVGLIDDAALAELVAGAQHRERGLARRAVAAKLRQRGFDDEVVAAALDRHRRRRRAGPGARAGRSGDSAPWRRCPADVQARRLVGLLARKGYPTGLAYEVVREASLTPDGIRRRQLSSATGRAGDLLCPPRVHNLEGHQEVTPEHSRYAGSAAVT